MKYLSVLFSTALLGTAALLTAPAAQAQVNVNLNVGRPAWGPPAPQGTQFYYIPEIDGYYDLYARQYIVYRGGQWVPVAVVDGYDPRGFHPVVLDYRGRQPWMYVRTHRDRYPRRGIPPGQAKKMYRQGYQQGYREDRRDDRRDDRDDDRGHGNGHGNGNGNGHGHGHGRD